MNLSPWQKYIISIGMTACVFTAVGYFLGTRQVDFAWSNFRPSVTVNERTPYKYAQTNMSSFWRVWDIVTTMSIDRDKLTPEKMIQGASAGLVSALEDPYSMYLTQEQNKESKNDLAGTFQGVGMELGYNEEKQLVVIAPIKDSPAQKAGILIGDKIWEINGEPSIVMPIQQAVSKIRGEKGTQVKLKVQQENSEPRDIEITRDTIVIKSVEVTYLENESIAHIELNRFGDGTVTDWDRIVNEIRGKNIRKIVLDVRGNPGGYFQTAVHVASDFMTGPVVMQEDYKGVKQNLTAINSQRLRNSKVIVLTNKGSASASEIVAGALNDKTDAILMGETSFGKGTVQDVIDFEDGSGIHITIAKWLTPNGTWVHKEGIKPDIEVKDETPQDQTDDVLNRAVEELKK